MEITTLYQKTRREFGRSVDRFSSTDSYSLGEWPSDPTVPEASYIVRDPTSLEIQAIPDMSEHEVNTERFVHVNHGMLHTEGGWPKDIDPTEKEQTTRYRKKIEKDEEYIRQIKALGEGVEHSIMQNNAIDIYQVRCTPSYPAGAQPARRSHACPEPANRSTLRASTPTTRASRPRPRLSPSSSAPPPAPAPVLRWAVHSAARGRRGSAPACAMGAMSSAHPPTAARAWPQGPERGEAHRVLDLVVPGRRQEAGGRVCDHAVPRLADGRHVEPLVHLGREQPEQPRDGAAALVGPLLPRVQPKGPAPARGRLVRAARRPCCVGTSCAAIATSPLAAPMHCRRLFHPSPPALLPSGTMG